MPAFINSPFQLPKLLMKGVPCYLIGSFSYEVGNANLAMATNAIAANVATITATPLNGPLPVAGSLISIYNSANGAGEFNVTRVAITSATYNSTTNLTTIVFPLTGSNQTATADSGTIIVEPAEVGETVSTTYTSAACVVQAPEGDSQFTLPFVVTGAAGITAMTATLQVAIDARTNEWTNTTTVVTKTGASTYTAGPVVQATLQRGYAYRVAITAVTGSGLVVAKVG
jgi:hypothetical protein